MKIFIFVFMIWKIVGMMEIIMISSIRARQICRPKTMTGFTTTLAPPPLSPPHPALAAHHLIQAFSFYLVAFLQFVAMAFHV